MIRSIKTKVLVYIGLMHAGLALAAIACLRAGSALDAGGLSLLVAGVGTMYAAFLFSALSIWLPLRPWLARYQHIIAIGAQMIR